MAYSEWGSLPPSQTRVCENGNESAVRMCLFSEHPHLSARQINPLERGAPGQIHRLCGVGRNTSVADRALKNRGKDTVCPLHGSRAVSLCYLIPPLLNLTVSNLCHTPATPHRLNLNTPSALDTPSRRRLQVCLSGNPVSTKLPDSDPRISRINVLTPCLRYRYRGKKLLSIRLAPKAAFIGL